MWHRIEARTGVQFPAPPLVFIGHYAVGFASKKFAPKASLGPLLAAPLALDILWPLLVLAGVEKVRIVPGFSAFNPLDLYYFPWSHSLLMACVWGGLFGGGYYAITKYRAGGVVIFFGVVSHWVLDWVSHTPDMAIVPGMATKVGLGLWNSVAGTVVVESILFIAAVWLYARTTRARDAVGRWGWWALVVVLAVLYVASAIGPPPSSVPAMVTVGLALQAVTVAWAWWADRHREVVLPTQAAPAGT